MSISGEIEKLKAQHAAGTLSDAEFEAAKARVLAGAAPEAGRQATGTGWAVWTLVVVVIVAAGAVLFALDDISRSVKTIAGGAGLVAAAAGAIMSATGEMSVAAALGFALAGLAIGAVAFAALSPILIPLALVLLALVAVWAWLGDLFTG